MRILNVAIGARAGYYKRSPHAGLP
jgi:hypothetical protein